ncbi:MAG: hypothetical protein WCT46_04560 [Candidatus Gracilibacteria bacterium]|jgi:hypothetical protein
MEIPRIVKGVAKTALVLLACDVLGKGLLEGAKHDMEGDIVSIPSGQVIIKGPTLPETDSNIPILTRKDIRAAFEIWGGGEDKK